VQCCAHVRGQGWGQYWSRVRAGLGLEVMEIQNVSTSMMVKTAERQPHAKTTSVGEGKEKRSRIK
jgi:hypothetical protein